MANSATSAWRSTLNNRHRVWVEIQNYKNDDDDWVIKPGMRAEIVIQLARGRVLGPENPELVANRGTADIVFLLRSIFRLI